MSASRTPSPSPSVAAAYVSGDAQTFDHIVDMGFNRPEVETCMRAALNDAGTAVEFLLGDIPAMPSICSAADAQRDLLQRIENSDSDLTKLRRAGTALALWRGEASWVEFSDFHVKFHKFSTVRGAEFRRSESRAYYKIEVKETCECPQFGFCTSEFQKQLPFSDEGCGDDFHSWAWDGTRRMFWLYKEQYNSQVKWNAGDCLGFEIDFTTNTTTVSINGVFVHSHEFSSRTHTLYACMTAHRSNIYVNFGWNIPGKSFAFPPHWAGPSGVALYSRELDYGILLRAMSSNKHITSLNLNDSTIDPAVASFLFPALIHLSYLSHLNLNGTGLKSFATSYLCSTLSHLTSLTCFDISDNYLTADDGARLFGAAATAGMASLTILDLHNNPCHERPFSSWDVVSCKVWNELNLPKVFDEYFLKIADVSALFQCIMSSDMHGFISTFCSSCYSDQPAVFHIMSSRAHFEFDALPFAQRLQAILHGRLLPAVVNLGMFKYTVGEIVEEEDFRTMTAKELLRLALRLQSQPFVTHLNLNGHKFRSEGMHVLAVPISMQTQLQELCLSANSFGPTGGEYIATALRELTGLQTLRLRYNSIGPTGAEHFAMALRELTGLQTLELSKNDFGPAGAEHIALALRELTGLQTLDVSSNSFGPTGGEYIATALRELTRLRWLDLSYNDFGPTGGECIATALKDLTGLQTLELSWNTFGPSVAGYIALALRELTDLQALDLSRNEFGPAGGECIATALRELTGLQTLRLHSNEFGPTGGEYIATALMELTGLQTLRLHCLAIPPDEVVGQGWMPVIKFLQAGPCVAVRELRLMLIGDGEAGKTSLSRAFLTSDRRAGRIAKEQRTVGIDLSVLSFAAADGEDIACQVCDFAGQEIYHLSHTLHFTRRCLYLLMWTTHKFSESDTAMAVAVGDIVGPLKRWLQLLASNVPEANVMVVGTHCMVDPDVFAVVQQRVDEEVKEEMERLRFIAEEEATATFQVVELQKFKVRNLVHDIEKKLPAIRMLRVPGHDDSLLRHEEFVEALGALSPKPARSLQLQARALLKAMQELARTRLRLGQLHGVYDGSEPAASAGVAHLKLVNERSFAVDSVAGVGVGELLRAIEATCRDSSALPFMGEQVPVSWLQVKKALTCETVRAVVGDCVMSVGDAAVKVRAALQQVHVEIDVGSARSLSIQDVRSSLEFWALLGRVFVHDGYFLRDAWFVIELLKPLVHHSVTSRKFLQDFCTGSFDGISECLLQLQRAAVLDHRLLPRFKAWAAASPEARLSMMQFFKDAFMISDLVVGSAAVSGRSLVTARLCDSSDADRQREVAAQAAAIEAASEYYAVYAVPSAHIGLIARMQATVAMLQLCHLEVRCGKDHICLERGGQIRCCVSVRRLEEVFESKLGSLRELVPLDQYSHALSICSNDGGLFVFAARCIDEMMRCCAFGCIYQAWLPCRPLQCAQDGAAWGPRSCDWVRLETAGVPKSLFEILSSNASDVVVPSRNLRLKDVLPRKSPIFMSHTYSGDGTGEFCQRIKDALQERLICTVWFDKKEMNETSAFVEEMQIGMRTACFFVICLTPLYLTRPNCLRELRWALDICTAAGSNKKMLVMPLHPAVSFKGCQRIIEAAEAGRPAHVFLRCDDRNKACPMRLHELKGHRLSSEAIALLRRLTDQYGASVRSDWLKLQPWLSDERGADWEDTSCVWTEGSAVTAGELLASSFPVIMACMAAPSEIVDFSFFNPAQEQLAAHPPSQDYLTPGDAAVIRQCFPLSDAVLSEQDITALVHLGLSDGDIMGCIEHGYDKLSVVTAQVPAAASESMGRQVNPVDATFRLAAHLSGVDFAHARARLHLLRQQQQHELQLQLPRKRKSES